MNTPTPPLIADTATARPWALFHMNGIIAIKNPRSRRSHNEIVFWTGFDASHYPKQALANAALIVEAVNSHDVLKARVAELESNERAYEAVLGQRTYNEVALHIKEMEVALRPFADFADPRNMIPPDTILTAGSPLARKQITMADCYAAAAALTNGDAS